MYSISIQYISNIIIIIIIIFPFHQTRWEVRGIPDAYQPQDLSLSFKGTIYPDRKQGTQSKLRSKFDINLSLIVSPLLGWVPHTVIHGLTESVSYIFISKTQVLYINIYILRTLKSYDFPVRIYIYLSMYLMILM